MEVVVNVKTWLLYPRVETPVPIELEAGWAPEEIWTFWTENLFPLLWFESRNAQFLINRYTKYAVWIDNI